MILTNVNGDLEKVLSGEIQLISRKAGQHMYRKGRVYPIQPARYQKHVAHVRVHNIETVAVGEILDDPDWDWRKAGVHYPSDRNEPYDVIAFHIIARCDGGACALKDAAPKAKAMMKAATAHRAGRRRLSR